MNYPSDQLQPITRLPALLEAISRQLQFLQEQITTLQKLRQSQETLDELSLARLRRIYSEMADLPTLLHEQLVYWDTVAVTTEQRNNLELFAQCITVLDDGIAVILELIQLLRTRYSA
ncbi:hypothetical protein [Undibacterium luofuense]|uniref:hypothetical protein n=1 Tax=Undibacterium luofuense TaxID=2828733 RepID=UPI0030ED1723